MKSRMQLARDIASDLSMRHRCHLLSVPRSSAYYQSKRQNVDDADFLNEICEIYERHPFKGYKRITDDLAEQGYVINHKRVYRLLKLMGLQAIYPKKNLSKRRQKDAVYPYLLKENPPMKSHDCWCVDITYIKTGRGYIEIVFAHGSLKQADIVIKEKYTHTVTFGEDENQENTSFITEVELSHNQQ